MESFFTKVLLLESAIYWKWISSQIFFFVHFVRFQSIFSPEYLWTTASIDVDMPQWSILKICPKFSAYVAIYKEERCVNYADML